MSKGLNKCFFIGVLGNDPEVRNSAGGSLIVSMSLAINESRKSGDKWEDHTEWVRMVCFGSTAKAAQDFLRKGSKIHVEGRLQTTSWEKDGTRHYKSEIVVQNLTFLDNKNNTGTSQPRETAAQQNAGSRDEDTSGLPF